MLAKFQGRGGGRRQAVKTDIPQSMLGYFVNLSMKTKELPVVKIDLRSPVDRHRAAGLLADPVDRRPSPRAHDAVADALTGTGSTDRRAVARPSQRRRAR